VVSANLPRAIDRALDSGLDAARIAAAIRLAAMVMLPCYEIAALMPTAGSEPTGGRPGMDVRTRLAALEAESQVRDVLSRYGLYADHHMIHEWLGLFTEDAFVDTILFTGPDAVDPSPEQFQHYRLVGRDDLRTYLIDGDAAHALPGPSQHHMGGQPARFRLLDPDHAALLSYGVVYSKRTGEVRPQVSYQSHTTNLWTFRRDGGVWRISSCSRRRMGHPESADLVFRFTDPVPPA
jgi:hypothetical protein